MLARGLLWHSAGAPLTLGNRLEILQDAREKYPWLMTDLRAATEPLLHRMNRSSVAYRSA